MKPTLLRILACGLAACLGLGCPAAAIAAGSTAQRDLLGTSDKQHFWIARVVTEPGKPEEDHTLLNFRGEWGEEWTALPAISSRVVSLASDSGELLAVLQNGQWMIANETTLRLGPPPPDFGRVLAMANQQTSIWAIVTDNGPTTRSSTQSATTQLQAPSIVAPPARRWIAYQLNAGKWTAGANLPASADVDDPADLSLAVVNQLPVIAWRDGGAIQVSRLTENHVWSAAIAVEPAVAGADFRLLGAEGKPDLWIAGSTSGSAASAGELYFGDDFSRWVSLQIQGTPPPPGASQALTTAYEYLRWLAAKDDQLYEQEYLPNGQPRTQMQSLGPNKPLAIPLEPYLTGAGVVVAIAALAATAQRRSRPNSEPPGQISLESGTQPAIASMFVRLGAGLIDLVPTIAALGMLPYRSGEDIPPIDLASARHIAMVALALYVVHTAVSEYICGQSIGKMMFGLRVVKFSGTLPWGMRIVWRSLFRLVDFVPFISLAVMLLSDQRQRVGDFVAGTIVISDDAETPAGAED